MSQVGYSLQIKNQADSHVGDYLFDRQVSMNRAGYRSFRWIKKEKKRAELNLIISENGEAYSLPQAPFGGVKLFSACSSESISQFLQEVIAELKRQQVTKLLITQRPKPYEKNTELIQYLLHRQGFEMESILNHQFFIGKKKIKQWLKEEGVKYQKKRKAQKIEVEKGPIRNFDFLNKISEWNGMRGYSESLDLNAIVQQVSVFPDRYFSLLLRKDGQLVAAALAVSLTSDSLYYFKSGIDPKTDLKQVGDILLTQLFSLATDLKVDFIDLGSSDLELGVNHQLIFFKSRFSNDQFNKISWSMTI